MGRSGFLTLKETKENSERVTKLLEGKKIVFLYD